MVANYFGLPYAFEDIAKLSRYRRTGGMTNASLVKTFQKLGLHVSEKSSAQWGSIMRANTPDTVIVVSWMMFGYIGHFSVVEKIDKDHIDLADPHVGEVSKMEKIIFMRLWMDYGNHWYPKKNTDIQLRWMCVVSKEHSRMHPKK